MRDPEIGTTLGNVYLTVTLSLKVVVCVVNTLYYVRVNGCVVNVY